MATGQITLNVSAVVTGIRISAAGRITIDGVLQDTTTGATVRSFSEDVTDQLTPTQLAHVTAIVQRAQQWADGHIA